MIKPRNREMRTKSKKPKYKNIKTEIDGIEFDSKKEAKRYVELKRMQENGQITDLECQPVYELCGAVRLDGRKRPARHYKADFRYKVGNHIVVEDVKGFKTQMYKFKRHLMKWVHDIEVVEV